MKYTNDPNKDQIILYMPYTSPGALDFEIEKKSRKLIFLGKLLEGA